MRPETERVITELGISKFGKKNRLMLEEAEKNFAEGEHAIYAANLNVTAVALGTRNKELFPSSMVCFTNKRMIVNQKTALYSGAFNVELKDVRSVTSHGSSATNGYIDLTTDTMEYEILASHKKEERERVQNLITDAVKKCQAADGTSAGTPSNEDIFAQIERLGELRDKGLLTDEEFNTKKSELLSRL